MVLKYDGTTNALLKMDGYWDFDWKISAESRHLYQDDAFTCERCKEAFFYLGVTPRRIENKVIYVCHTCADEDLFVCYKCQQTFYDLGVSQMLKGNEVVTVCHVCRREAVKPKGPTQSRELHDVAPLPEKNIPSPKDHHTTTTMPSFLHPSIVNASGAHQFRDGIKSKCSE